MIESLRPAPFQAIFSSFWPKKPGQVTPPAGDTDRVSELTFQLDHLGGPCVRGFAYDGDLFVTEIKIVDYDPNWPALFEEEAARLRAVLDQDLIVGLEHFGSTSIPGLAAKPIIDILILVRSLADARARFVEPLQRLGYVLRAANRGLKGMFFVKGISPSEDRRTHIVHITLPGQGVWRGLCFRDYLRAHPEEAARYERLKRDLADRHQADRWAYGKGKYNFISEIVLKAKRQDAAAVPSPKPEI
jgi:GrpB-like predicted nucleotidyltransferase (UPF0157 family)